MRIADLINDNANSLQICEFQQKFGIRGTFLEYQSLLAKYQTVGKIGFEVTDHFVF